MEPVESTVLTTERLRLVLDSPAGALARVEALGPAERAEVSPDWLARVRAIGEAEAAGAADPWVLGFSFTERTGSAAVGGCGSKGPPDADGVVEVAYWVDPAHRGRGYAAEACRALVEFAFGSGSVRIVRAHTKTGNVASERVLLKCGFERTGEVIDPEDGLVWRWERADGRAGPTAVPDPVSRGARPESEV